jgi:hypothetical protein
MAWCAGGRLEEIARAKALDCDTIEIWSADEARIGQKNPTSYYTGSLKF